MKKICNVDLWPPHLHVNAHTYAHTGTYERESLKNIETVNLTETEAGKKKINVTSRPYPQGVPEIPDKFKKK